MLQFHIIIFVSTASEYNSIVAFQPEVNLERNPAVGSPNFAGNLPYFVQPDGAALRGGRIRALPRRHSDGSRETVKTVGIL
jgi:hypothetical protein